MASPAPTPINLMLRAGSLDDLDEVMRIMGQAFRPCFGEGWTRSQCAGILPMTGVALTIAEDEGMAVGFSLSRAVADEAELLLIAVDPDRQGHGAGSLLLRHFISAARTHGASRMHLEVRDGNPAVSLYRRSGFLPAGRRRNYYKGPDGERYDAVTLMLVD
jgi:[ribosomal protein S18]-alanine N-acetyltransferase